MKITRDAPTKITIDGENNTVVLVDKNKGYGIYSDNELLPHVVLSNFIVLGDSRKSRKIKKLVFGGPTILEKVIYCVKKTFKILK